MKRSVIFWILAFIITAASATYQRMTGPTYPMRGSVLFHGKQINYNFDRSQGGTSGYSVKLKTDDNSITGFVEWKRFKTGDVWTKTQMNFAEGELSADLPNQPPAGKLVYRVILRDAEKQIVLPEGDPVVIRFKGDVPAAVLIVHVIAMFGAMFLSTRAGLECFAREGQLKKFIYWTIGFLFVGGFILGPMVQWYAFGALWTGWPVGKDLTDNKTALALISWIIAAFALRKSRNPKMWAIAAAVITFAVYLIPHSVLGSELDYSKLPSEGTTLQR